MPLAARERTAIVLCCWRGRAHLGEQLDSIGSQSRRATLIVHDDASGDGTAALAAAHPAVDSLIEHAENVGHVRNFERALADALNRGHDYVAFADQDDLWHPRRVEIGLAAMRDLERRHGPETPALVHSDLSMIDARGETLAPSFLRWRGYDVDDRVNLARMLGQCGVMGNTCLINRSLATLALPFPPALHVHDWWLGLLAELYGRRRFVSEPLVRYRIHSSNTSNALTTLDGGAGRPDARRLLGRDFRLPFMEDTRHAVLDALVSGDGHRPPPQGEARRTIDDFRAYLHQEGSRTARLRRLLRGGYLRPARAHRLRVAAALMLTRRYEASR